MLSLHVNLVSFRSGPQVPAWRNWQTRWTQNPVFAPRDIFAPSHGCEHARQQKNKTERGTVNTLSTAPFLLVARRVFATHVQKNVALAGLVNAIDLAGYRSRFPNVLWRFLGCVIGSLSENRSGAQECQQREGYFYFHGFRFFSRPISRFDPKQMRDTMQFLRQWSLPS
jgi:hypothetical protein